MAAIASSPSKTKTRDAGSRHRLLPRCRRHLAAVALAGRDRHLFRADRRDHERRRRDLCRLRRCATCRRGKLARLARGADASAGPAPTPARSARIIDGFATAPDAGPGAAHRSRRSTRWFAHDTHRGRSSRRWQRDGSEFAQATLKTLNGQSRRRSLKVTLKLLRLARGGAARWKQCLVREYRAALQVFASDDFVEGVRAAVIDKDRNPKWRRRGSRT